MTKVLKYARIERERRYLLSMPPVGLNMDGDYSRIVDLYVPNTRMRLRRIEKPSGHVLEYKLTQKYPCENQSPQHRIITNIYLDLVEYEKMSILGGRKLIKRRYEYWWDEHRYIIDVFAGHLRGLILAEIETLDDKALGNLPLPPFAICEVTGESFFTGGCLARLSSAEFREWLRQAKLAL